MKNKTSILFFLSNFPTFKNTNVIQPGIPLTSISDYEFHENSWVSSLSKQLKFLISLEYRNCKSKSCQNRQNVCFENGTESAFSVWRGQQLGVNSEGTEDCEWSAGQMNSWVSSRV